MIVVDKGLCDHCGTCVAVCQPDAIDLFYNDININHEKCIQCLRCVWVCPVGAPKQVKAEKDAAP